MYVQLAFCVQGMVSRNIIESYLHLGMLAVLFAMRLYCKVLRDKQTSTILNQLKNLRSSFRKCSVKEVLLKILQNLQENICLREISLFKKSLWYMYFPVNFAKFLRATFFTEHMRATPSRIQVILRTRNNQFLHLILNQRRTILEIQSANKIKQSCYKDWITTSFQNIYFHNIDFR